MHLLLTKNVQNLPLFILCKTMTKIKKFSFFIVRKCFLYNFNMLIPKIELEYRNFQFWTCFGQKPCKICLSHFCLKKNTTSRKILLFSFFLQKVVSDFRNFEIFTCYGQNGFKIRLCHFCVKKLQKSKKISIFRLKVCL